MLKRDEFYQWKMDPVGQEFFKEIREARDKWVEFLVSGNANYELTCGIIKGMDTVLEYEAEG